MPSIRHADRAGRCRYEQQKDADSPYRAVKRRLTSPVYATMHRMQTLEQPQNDTETVCRSLVVVRRAMDEITRNSGYEFSKRCPTAYTADLRNAGRTIGAGAGMMCDDLRKRKAALAPSKTAMSIVFKSKTAMIIEPAAIHSPSGFSFPPCNQS